ncbi:MAG: RluA family pseudouridine synthase [Treponema sp.]|nr:RluA family pseudouridine synthase [Treponema sp.]
MVERLCFNTTEKIRLDEYLRKVLPECKELEGKELSNSKIRRLIVAGAVSVNARGVVRPSFELRGKSEVCVELDLQKFFYEKQPDDINFEVTPSAVLYEDDDLIFIDKPEFFPVEQTITGNRANLHDAVVDYLWKQNPCLHNPPYAGIMHRLDRTTSGVIVFTKNRTVNKRVSEIFQARKLTKKYLAVVEVSGHAELVPASNFTIEMFMGRVSSKSQAAKWGELSESRGGQYSKTEFRVLKEITVEKLRCAVLECNLFTGRTHQIRVHLASRGYPILGDTLYGGKEARRLYLHAYELAFELNGKAYDIICNNGSFRV